MHIIQVVGVGNVGVGKTSLIKHFCESKVCRTASDHIDSCTYTWTNTTSFNCISLIFSWFFYELILICVCIFHTMVLPAVVIYSFRELSTRYVFSMSVWCYQWGVVNAEYAFSQLLYNCGNKTTVGCRDSYFWDGFYSELTVRCTMFM